MPHILYGGVKYVQIRHALFCKKCKQTIESKDVHEFSWCNCGSIGIDGGICDGNTLLGDSSYMETRSMYCALINKKVLWLPQEIIEQQFLTMV
jgi:hypothetical protein